MVMICSFKRHTHTHTPCSNIWEYFSLFITFMIKVISFLFFDVLKKNLQFFLKNLCIYLNCLSLILLSLFFFDDIFWYYGLLSSPQMFILFHCFFDSSTLCPHHLSRFSLPLYDIPPTYDNDLLFVLFLILYTAFLTDSPHGDKSVYCVYF